MRLIIAGTFVTPLLARLVYQPMSRALDARITHLDCMGMLPVKNQVDRIARRLNREGPADLIGHSQGGLVAALVAVQHPELVRKVVTIGGPLQGTPLAPRIIPGAVGDMAVGSRVVDKLRSYPWDAAQNDLLSVVGTKDLLVPIESAILPRTTVAYFDMGHVELVAAPAVNRVIQDWLAN